jgi:hypothetical protein
MPRHARRLRILILPALLIALAGPARAEDAVAIMKAMEAGMQSDGEELLVQMDLAGPSGSESRTFRMWSQAKEGKPIRSLLRFESPGSIAGTALLTVRRPGKAQDSWLYVPALDQVRRVAPSDRSQSFVGSDFTIEDLAVSVDPEARTYTLVGESACGQGRTCYQVEDKPATTAAAKASGYGRVVMHVDKELKVAHRIDFYDASDGLLKVLMADGLVEVGGEWRFDKATVTNVQAGTSTTMTVQSRSWGAAIDESIFSPSSLDAW